MRNTIEITGGRHAEILIHMLGAGNATPVKNHGYRNRYCAVVGDETHRVLLEEMEPTGLVVAGPLINDGRDQMFSATVRGCKAIGLNEAAIKRAMAD